MKRYIVVLVNEDTEEKKCVCVQSNIRRSLQKSEVICSQN